MQLLDNTAIQIIAPALLLSFYPNAINSLARSTASFLKSLNGERRIKGPAYAATTKLGVMRADPLNRKFHKLHKFCQQIKSGL